MFDVYFKRLFNLISKTHFCLKKIWLVTDGVLIVDLPVGDGEVLSSSLSGTDSFPKYISSECCTILSAHACRNSMS